MINWVEYYPNYHTHILLEKWFNRVCLTGREKGPWQNVSHAGLPMLPKYGPMGRFNRLEQELAVDVVQQISKLLEIGLILLPKLRLLTNY